MRYAKWLLLFSCIYLVFSCPLCPAQAEDLTGLYQCDGIFWLLADYSDVETDVLSTPVELEAGDLPVEVQLSPSGDWFEPELNSITLVYPVGTPAEQKMKLVEIWVYSDEDAQRFKQVFRGNLDASGSSQSIKVEPCIAGYIDVRFFSSHGDAPPVLPAIEINGHPQCVGHAPDLSESKSITDEFDIVMEDHRIGNSSVTRRKIHSGFQINEDYNYDFQLVLPFQEEPGIIKQKYSCEYLTDKESYISEFECSYELGDDASFEIIGKSYSKGFYTRTKGRLEGIADLELENGEMDVDEYYSIIESDEKTVKFLRQENKCKLDVHFFATTASKTIISEPLIYHKLAEEGMAVGMTKKFRTYHFLRAPKCKLYKAFDDDKLLPKHCHDNEYLGYKYFREGVRTDCEMLEFIDVYVDVLEYLPATDNLPELFAVMMHDEKHEAINQISLVQPDGTVMRSFDYIANESTLNVDAGQDYGDDSNVIDLKEYYNNIKNREIEIVNEPDNATAANIKIRWNNIDPDMLDLESTRQRILSIDEVEPGVFEAEIETARVFPEDPSLIETEPLSQSEIESFLISDQQIQSDSEKLIEIAEDIAGGEEDPLEIAILTFNWLIRNIYPKNVNSFSAPPSEKILDEAAGDCKYFAVMFATLARINGIPTRFAFGQRYIGGEYGYHVWNQIYIDDRWLDVDASDLGFFPGSLHIQIDTSSTFNSKAYIGALLGFRPDHDLSRLDTEEPYFPVVDGAVETMFDGDMYQDAFYGCRVRFFGNPEKELIDLGFIKKIELTFSGDKDIVANIYLLPLNKNDRDKELASEDLFDLFTSLSAENFIQLTDMFGAIKSVGSEKIGETTIAGRDAFFVSGSMVSSEEGYVHFDINMVQLENSAVFILFSAPTDKFDKHEKIFTKIKKSVEEL